MGRTVMPFSYVLEKEHGRWTEFRKGLGKKDQQTFDRLFDRAKFRTAAAVYMAPPWPLQTILLSICLEHEKMLGDILGKVKERDATRSAMRVALCNPTCQESFCQTGRLSAHPEGSDEAGRSASSLGISLPLHQAPRACGKTRIFS